MHHHHIAKAAALMLCIVLLCGAAGCSREERPARVALIVSSSSGHYWENIQDGAQTAAQRLGAELTCYAPDEEKGIRLEELPQIALEEDADIFVVASNGEEELVTALTAIEGMNVIAVGDNLSELSPLCAVINDNSKMGENMALALSGKVEKSGSAMLLTDTSEYDNKELREMKLRSGLFSQRISVSKRIFTGDNREWAYRQTLQELYLHPELDAIVAFSAQATVGAAQAVDYLDCDMVIVGTDIVPDLIECIENGQVTASVVRNSFGMGYLGVEYAVECFAGEPIPAKKTLASVVVTRDNLFTPEIEKVVFPYD